MVFFFLLSSNRHNYFWTQPFPRGAPPSEYVTSERLNDKETRGSLPWFNRVTAILPVFLMHRHSAALHAECILCFHCTFRWCPPGGNHCASLFCVLASESSRGTLTCAAARRCRAPNRPKPSACVGASVLSAAVGAGEPSRPSPAAGELGRHGRASPRSRPRGGSWAAHTPPGTALPCWHYQ